jgi:hypothetical protein
MAMKGLTEPTPRVTAALATLAASTATHAMDQFRDELSASALAKIAADLAPRIDTHVLESLAKIAADLAPRIDAQVLEALAQIAADLAPRIDAQVLEALAQIDFSALRPAIDAATRDIIERAAVIEAVGNSSYRAALYKIADDHHGYVTTALAQAAGVPSVEVRKIASRGGMTNIARGLYRVDGIDGGDHAAYAEAVLRVGEDAHLVGDSVLAFHELALVNPRHITVSTPRRVRRDVPTHIRIVHTRIDPTDLTEYDGIASTTVERAIRDSIGSIMAERLVDATRRAADEGLLRRSATDTLLHEIGAAT